MAITPTNRHNILEWSNPTATYSTGGIAYTAGDRIVVCVDAFRDNHSVGLGANWGISDDATTNSITWTELIRSGIDESSGANFFNESVCFYSSALTDDETIDVTIDPHTGGGQAFFYVGNVADLVSWAGTFEQDAKASESNGDTGSITFDSAPSEFQFVWTGAITDDTVTWDTIETDFTVLAGSEHNDTGVAGSRIATSTTATATLYADGYTSSTTYSTHIIAMELTEVAAGGGLLVPKLSVPKRHLLTR